MTGARTLDGRIVLVTGAGNGIGRAIAELAARSGATVIAADIDANAAHATVDAITAAGGAATPVAADATDPDDLDRLFTRITSEYGRLDAAVNNAGVEGAISETHEYPLDAFDRVLALNVRGVFLCMQRELTLMLAQSGGVIVNISSIAGFRGFAGFAAYNASKHAVVGLTRTAALEYATRGIRVNSVAPGFTVTPMVTDRGLRAQPGSDDFRAIEDIHPMKRLADPSEIAQAVVWMCSDAATFVTGHNLAVDGGYLAT